MRDIERSENRLFCFCVALIFYFFGLVLVYIWQADKLTQQAEKEECAQYEDISYDDQFKELRAIEAALANPGEADKPADYFALLKRRDSLGDSARRMKYYHPEEYRVVSRPSIEINAQNLFMDPVLPLRFHLDDGAEDKQEFTAYRQERMSRIPSKGSGHGMLILWLYAAGALPMPMFHKLRLEKNGSRFWPEVFSYRPYFFTMVYPLSWLYKTPEPRKQLARAWQVIMSVMSFMISLFGCGAKVMAQTQTGSTPDPTTKNKKVQIDGSITVLPKYLILDGQVVHPAPVQQDEVVVTLPNGLSLDVFLSTPATSRPDLKKNFGLEFDFAAGYRRKIKQFVLDFTAKYVNVVPLDKIWTGDVLELSARGSREFKLSDKQKIVPYIWLRLVRPLHGKTPGPGEFIHLGASHGWQIKPGVKVASDLSLIYDDGALGQKPGFLGRLAQSLNWKLNSWMTLQAPVLRAESPITATHDGRRFQFVIGGGFTFHR